jgi:hypothetical protein
MITGELFNIQSIPEMVATRSSCVSTSKIYINIVKSAVLPHPPTKDLSVFTPSKFAVFLLYYSVLPLVGGSFGLLILRPASDDSTY